MSSTIGQLVKGERERRGWSRDELGRRAGMPGQHVGVIERAATQRVSLRTAVRLSRALGVKLTAFVEAEDATEVAK